MNSNPQMVKSVNGQGVQFPNRDGGIRLGLRVLKIEREIAELHLPNDIKKLMEGALADRQLTFECKYRQVCRWIEMQKRGSFWRDFGCKTLEELWARLDLPGGVALANWEILVRLFDRETFLLVGDDALGYMTRYIATYQQNIELRKQDYQQIFDNYCKQYAAFDASSFRRHINWHVNQKYVLPQLDEPRRQQLEKSKKPPRLVPAGVIQRREAVTIDQTESQAPLISPAKPATPIKDFAIRYDTCGGCADRDRYIAELESVIVRHLGAEYIPKKKAS